MLGRTSLEMPRGEDDPIIEGKSPLLEAFVSGRFFTFTGNRLEGSAADVRAAPDAWKWLADLLGAHSEQTERPMRDYADVELKTVADALRWFSSDDVDRNTAHCYQSCLHSVVIQKLEETSEIVANGSETCHL